MRERTDRFKVSEGNELHNVPEDGFALRWAQHSIISVQNLHVCEVCIAHTDDDYGERLVGGSYNGFTCVCHICHYAIGEDEQDVVSLEEDKSFQCELI